MTLEEAKSNIYRPVTAVDGESRFNGKIQEVNDGYVRVNFGNGNLEPSCWYLPEQLSFGWTGDQYRPPTISEWNSSKEMKPEYVGYNLNHPVRVRLTEQGFKVWKLENDLHVSPHASEQLKARLIKPLEYYTDQVDEDGYVEMEFHFFMGVFGERIRMGYDLVDMNVQLPKNKIKQL